MNISGKKVDDKIMVTLEGRLDVNGSYIAEQHFLKYALSGNVFVLDFEKVELISSAGIRALLSLYRTVSDNGGSVTILKPQEMVYEVLKETNFLELFNIERL